jgi:CheY-like chemotaxis protein
MASILCVGGDVELLQTRAAVLREFGADVEWVASRDALAAIERKDYDLVVLCHSVRQDETKQLYDAVHKRPGSSQVLRLTRASGWLDGDANADRVAKADPMTMVEAASELLRQPSGKIQRGQDLRS